MTPKSDRPESKHSFTEAFGCDNQAQRRNEAAEVEQA
eukprot:CAMPEP_0179195736 /NCGR_PEP_ID=MMETSP0796-20121207/97306_1 /TAXON_ID=73915 /ORGANISM="Pyrodinium bahamense, Strain pbaha01" /LENGTH=36 /DNA_ID= /DNA_START= /DNA_END= /DNA_ORIENTATION=